MDIFCQECGTKAVAGDVRCRNCGEKLPVPKQATQAPPTTSTSRSTAQTKAPMPKKQKVLFGVIILLIALLIGLYLFGKNYYSLESVQKRFDIALIKKDASTIQQLGIHENNTEITQAESEAFLKLLEIESRDYVKHFTSVQPYGKAFGMFDQYKIEFRNQFVYTTDYGEDVRIELNKKALNIHTNEEDLLTYGPLVPGVYTFEVAYKNDFGEANSTVEKRVDDEYGEGIRLDLESIDYVTAVLSQRIPVESVFVVNEKELKFDEDGRLRFGPILIDGSLSGHLVSKLPWGEVKSDEYPIDDNELGLSNALYSEKHFKEIAKLIGDFGEELVKSYATKSTKGYKTTSAEVKEWMADRIKYEYASYPLTVQLDQVHIAKDSISYYSDDKKKGIEIGVAFEGEIGDAGDSDLNDLWWERNLTLIYNEKDKKWLIEAIDSSTYLDYYEDIDVIAGSKKRHTTGKQTVESKEEKSDSNSDDLSAEMETFMVAANAGHVAAINDQEFSHYEHYTTSDGARREEARKYVASLGERGITQEHLSTEIEKVEKVDDSTYKVTTIEKYIIYKEGSGDEKTFRTVNTVKLVDNEFYIHKLEDTKEI